MKKNPTIGELFKTLEQINNWFEKEENIDLEIALEKVREGAKYIAIIKKKITQTENEFKEITAKIDSEF